MIFENNWCIIASAMGVVSKITNDISVSVETKFRDKQSDVANGYFLFSYFITIENLGQAPCRLLRRHWHILDSSGEHREVTGDGVVGEQPLLRPGEAFSYESACNFTTEIGRMHGVFFVENLLTHATFQVTIPEFLMVMPAKLN
jgi:ApaG protein